MATYNGSLYIERQFRSILCKLGEADEIILVDDFSSDATLEVVERLSDNASRFTATTPTKGVLRTFEQC